MRYSNTPNNPKYNPNVMPFGDTSTIGLTGDTATQAPLIPTPKPTFNPGIKPSGAPVNFNPKAQATMTSAFGMPTEGTYDRTLQVTPTI